MANNVPAVRDNGSAPVIAYSREEIEVIKSTHFKGLDEPQIQYALKKAERMGLDFFSGQVVAWPGKQGKVEVYTTIQGLRSKAEETGLFFPGREATFAYDSKDQLVSATAYVNRWDTRREAWVELSETSMMFEYASNTGAWQTHKHVMLAKTAEARCLRRVFPQLADLYIQEERGTEEDRQEAKAADREAAREAKLKKIAPAPAPAPAAEPAASVPVTNLQGQVVATAVNQTPGGITVNDGTEAKPKGEVSQMIADLTQTLAALSKPKKIVLFKRLQMEEPKDLSTLTIEDLGNILDAAVGVRG